MLCLGSSVYPACLISAVENMRALPAVYPLPVEAGSRQRMLTSTLWCGVLLSVVPQGCACPQHPCCPVTHLDHSQGCSLTVSVYPWWLMYRVCHAPCLPQAISICPLVLVCHVIHCSPCIPLLQSVPNLMTVFALPPSSRYGRRPTPTLCESHVPILFFNCSTTIPVMHMQAYYLAAPFPCERAPCELVKGLEQKNKNVRIMRTLNYPVNGFVIEVRHSACILRMLASSQLALQWHVLYGSVVCGDQSVLCSSCCCGHWLGWVHQICFIISQALAAHTNASVGLHYTELILNQPDSV